MKWLFPLLQGPLNFLKTLFKNPLVAIIYTFLSKWYLIFTLSGIIIIYYVFTGLKNIGLIDKAETILFQSIDNAKSISQHCIPKLANNIHDFWNCISHPPKYQADPNNLGERELNNFIKKTIEGENILKREKNVEPSEQNKIDPYE